MVSYMIRFIKLVIFKFIFGGLFIYSFDYIAMRFNLFLPINFFNICFVSLFGSCGLLVLVIFKFLI